MIKVLGIKIVDRIKEAGLTQGILSKHASVITTRLGFHEVTDSVCSREAYIILHLNDDHSDSVSLVKELETLGGIEIRQISFDDISQPSGHDGNSEVLCILVERDPGVITSVQRILTAYGCNIRTRLGVNENFFGQPAGLIILELVGDNGQRLLLEKDLLELKKVHTHVMKF